MNWYIATIAVYRVDRSGSGLISHSTNVEIHRFNKALQGDDAKLIHHYHPDSFEALARDPQDNLLVCTEIRTLRPAISGDDYRLIASAIDIACGKQQPRETWRSFGVACPRCEAKPGHECISESMPPGSSSSSNWYFHSERIAACKSK